MLDGGMKRADLVLDDLPQVISMIEADPLLVCSGVGTHLPSAEDFGQAHGVSEKNLQKFRQELSVFTKFLQIKKFMFGIRKGFFITTEAESMTPLGPVLALVPVLHFMEV